VVTRTRNKPYKTDDKCLFTTQ